MKFIIGCIIGLVLGAYFHDKDLVRNYALKGDACAWTGEIKR